MINGQIMACFPQSDGAFATETFTFINVENVCLEQTGSENEEYSQPGDMVLM